MKYLSTNNSKIKKGSKLNVLTAALSLAPDINTCPSCEIASCLDSCLTYSGMGNFSNVQAARHKKTAAFFRDAESFVLDLVKDCDALIRKAKREGSTPAVRLNCYSDINWAMIPTTRNGLVYKNIYAAFPELSFYDYTKSLAIARGSAKIPNLHITFSYSPAKEFQAVFKKALKLPVNIAVVFSGALPEIFFDRKVIDGDETDVRFYDASNVVVGLKLKGSKAVRDGANQIAVKQI